MVTLFRTASAGREPLFHYHEWRLFAFLGLTRWLTSALGQSWWAFLAAALAAAAFSAAALLASLLLRALAAAAAAATFASARAVALRFRAGLQLLAVVDDEHALALVGGLAHFQRGLCGGRGAGGLRRF